jgi:uncharacterized protein
MRNPTARMLPDGKRLHLHCGPIDLVVEADGEVEEIDLAMRQATRDFRPVLTGLVAELTMLRTPVTPGRKSLHGPIASAMEDAALAFADHDVTPMIAVAGAVAQYITKGIVARRNLDRLYVNNGGDISLYLNQGHNFDIGIVNRIDAPEISMKARVSAEDDVGGIATSGWRGRSFSLGVADAVTVLASTAAMADAAATLIANEIDPGDCSRIERRPACELDPDSDLGERLVTTNVAALSDTQIDVALARGQALARQFQADGHIVAASLSLQDDVRLVGDLKPQRLDNFDNGERTNA